MNRETLYQHARENMKIIVARLLELSEITHNFSTPPDDIWKNDDDSIMLLCGRGYYADDMPETGDRHNRWLARSANPFNLERAATVLLYQKIQPFIDALVEKAFTETNNFRQIDARWIHKNPQYLPVLMHALGIFSKRDLQRRLGRATASDTKISEPTGKKIAGLFKDIDSGSIPRPVQITERIKATTEGIVRDLVGRLLLEDFVASALKKENIPFKREKEYESLSGVVYDLRADFIIPDPNSPMAFIEVRRSSSGHASLYAKDKMFSAINWKGRHKDCLGIIVVDGPWTGATLDIMSRVFDYVVPIKRAYEVAQKIRSYLDGDKSVLRWLIQFKIEEHKY